MQNRYVGDLGDFGKYGLLRAFSGLAHSETRFSLGVVWYLVPDEDHTNDGSRIQYLGLSKDAATVFRSCDPELYATLRTIIANRGRNVQSIRQGRVLPPGTTFFEEPLTFEGITDRDQRLACRAQWLERGYRATAACDLIFLDPDNGLDGSVKSHHRTGPKYVFLSEVEPYLSRGQSVMIYHHLGRRGTAKEQLDRQLTRLSALGTGATAFALLYHRGTARAFFIVESPAHKAVLLQRVTEFLCGPWSRHFELINCPTLRL